MLVLDGNGSRHRLETTRTMKLSYTLNNVVYASADSDRLTKDGQQEALNTAIEVLAIALNVHVKTIGYLLQNGWSQSLQDSYAGPRAKAKSDGADDDELLEIMHGSIEKRIKAMKEGLLSATAGGGRDPIRTVGLRLLESHVAERGKVLPKDKKKRQALLDLYIKQNREKIEAEIAKRKEAKG